jgi:asparagine synthase (glutamine-hydrolysing)
MCGITGIFSVEGREIKESWIVDSLKSLSKRGPDNQSYQSFPNACLGHARLSIIDTSSAANQPFSDPNRDWTMVFNGEIFNFKELKTDLEKKGIQFHTNSDTEVLLELYKFYGKDCLNQLNGFWAFAIYNHKEQSLFVARDRYGIKPLYYALVDGYFYFGSEMKAIMPLPFKKHLDKEALNLYFQLNYIPGPLSIFSEVKKLLPGYCIDIKNGNVNFEQFYKIPYQKDQISPIANDYEAQKKKLKELMEDSVRLRMIADVPLGAFLSGGIDSSVVVSQASKFTKNLNTFSIGFADNAFFDETVYANIVAKKYQTNHTVFKLKNEELFESLHEILDYIDEPFADSSALLVNLLSKYTRKHVTVALSGDAGDELFAGYNKHHGEYTIRNGGWKAQSVSLLGPVWKMLPKSRHGKFGNLFRQLERFALGMSLSQEERHWRWCCFLNDDEVRKLINSKYHPDPQIIKEVKASFLKYFTPGGDLNETLLADMNLVLPYDMLTKVDSMSMRNSLEVRVPFLDYRIVEFAFSLPVSSKIDNTIKKKIVQEAFREELPDELFNRPKRGFEVPLLQWFRTDLKGDILNKYLDQAAIKEAGIFNENAIESIKKRLFSNDPGDVHAQIWALIVFQNWLEKYRSYISL